MKYLNLTSSLLNGDSLLLEGDDYHHVIRVLRHREGETLWVRLAGQEELLETKIIEIQKKQAELVVLGKRLVARPSELKVHLILPWLKKEALEICLRQAVEAGVDSLTLVKTDFSVAESREFLQKKARYVKLLEQAGEQSGNPYLPSLEIRENLEEVLKEILKSSPLFYAHHEEGETQVPISSVLGQAGTNSCTLLIGAEGGISPRELVLLEQVGGTKVFFPTYVLRAYSASLYLISSVQNIYKEVQNGDRLAGR